MGSKEHTAAIELHPGHKPSEEKEEQKRHPAASVSVGDNWHEGQKSPWHGRTPRGARGVRSGHAKSWGEGVPDGFGAVVKERRKVLLIRFRVFVGVWGWGDLQRRRNLEQSMSEGSAPCVHLNIGIRVTSPSWAFHPAHITGCAPPKPRAQRASAFWGSSGHLLLLPHTAGKRCAILPHPLV